MPGVTTAARLAPAAVRDNTSSATAAPAGFELYVSSRMTTPRPSTVGSSRCGTAGNVGSRCATSVAVIPSSSATATAAATLPGRAPIRTERAISWPRTKTVSPLASSATHTSASRRRVETRTTRKPVGGAVVGQRGQTGVILDDHPTTRPVEDLGFGLDHAIHRSEALEMHRSDGGDHGDVGLDPRAQLGDLTAPVGPHLGHEDVGALGEVLVHARAPTRRGC